MTNMDRTPVRTVGQMPFAAGYISERAIRKRRRQQTRRRIFRKLAAKFGLRIDWRD